MQKRKQMIEGEQTLQALRKQELCFMNLTIRSFMFSITMEDVCPVEYARHSNECLHSHFDHIIFNYKVTQCNRSVK